jgi:hypothetical protein
MLTLRHDIGGWANERHLELATARQQQIVDPHVLSPIERQRKDWRNEQ